ncbi:hypothetical protein MNV49_005475 [Pseudohyphozyma bogoriensis]|nr:hypothetical protein MNV49_005475 [Pseudohyphozyma bogoriensis]
MSPAPPTTKKRVAVVGSGVTGISATWALNEHSEHEVHLFERDDRPGGHTNTVEWKEKKSGEKTWVDTGFIVFNTVTYPNFLSFLRTLCIPHMASEMSFAISRDLGAYEWAGGSPSSLFAQRINLLNPGQWRMVWDILRFNTEALSVLRSGGTDSESIGTYLERKGYSNEFRDNYLLPMTAAIWSTPPNTAALDFPALTLLRFMHNHHLLQILDRPVWLTLPTGSHSYVQRVLAKLPDEQLHLSTGIKSVSTGGQDGGVVLVDEGGKEWEFDHAVFATHADVTLGILESGEGITREERDVLGGFEFGKNRAVLHGDVDLMPKRESTWSAWNYLTSSTDSSANVNKVSLTYYMNVLQSIPSKVFGPVLVTLNPPFEPKQELVKGEYAYEHPYYTAKSVASQKKLHMIQNKRGLTFGGAWSGYGFHEDGFKSGLSLAMSHLNANPPFALKSSERPIPPTLLLTIFYFLAERLRRIAEFPWSYLMWFGVIWLEVLQWVLGVFGGKEEEGEGLAGQVREVRAMWEKSAGIGEAWKVKKEEGRGVRDQAG